MVSAFVGEQESISESDSRLTQLPRCLYSSKMLVLNTKQAFIEAHNSQKPAPSFVLGHNHFSDLTLDEYQEFNKLGSYSPGLMTPTRSRSNDSVMIASTLRRKRRLTDLPDAVDWVENGAIVPVKNQGNYSNHRHSLCF